MDETQRGVRTAGMEGGGIANKNAMKIIVFVRNNKLKELIVHFAIQVRQEGYNNNNDNQVNLSIVT